MHPVHFTILVTSGADFDITISIAILIWLYRVRIGPGVIVHSTPPTIITPLTV